MLAALLSLLVLPGSGAVSAGVLTGNVWPNPTLETAAGGGTGPAFWNKGGDDASLDLWDTAAAVSPTHSLRLNDTRTTAYGSWYSDLFPLAVGSNYTLQFFRRYQTPGIMRVSASFLDANNLYLAGAHFVVHGGQTNWTNTIAELIRPKSATSLRLELASGGSLSVTGSVWIDDVSLVPRPARTNAPGHLARIEQMPAVPTPFQLRDWRQVARNYDALVFNFSLSGQFLPLIRWDTARVNFARDSFWLPTYAGSTTHGGEAVNALAALVGATLAGLDKSNQQGTNFVLASLEYYNRANGQNVVLNHPSTVSGQSFWYELLPHILFYELVGQYPVTAREPVPFSSGGGQATMEAVMRSTAEQWRDAAFRMGGNTNRADFNWTAFDFATRKPVFNGSWREPDAAAGLAWVQYMAYAKFGDPQFLQGAAWGLDYLERIDWNPFYETLLPYGALVAARMNAEQDRAYNVQKLIEWCFHGDSVPRYGFGVIAENWGGYDAHGLVGSITDGGGYAFAMNTFQMAGTLAPLARYDPRYARVLGKWLLHVANNARLFYADTLPTNQQSSAFWTGDPGAVVPYEGLRAEWDGRRPVAMGDPLFNNWGPLTDRALYGGSAVGWLGGITATTSQSGVLRHDLLVTDFFHGPAHPTHLYYNPHPEARLVTVEVGPVAAHLFDASTGAFVATNMTGPVALNLAPTSAVVLVQCPASGAFAASGRKLLCDGMVIDYWHAATDSDADALPDWWESRYFASATNASPAAIAANGYTLRQCFQLGLDPLDANSTFRGRITLEPGTGFPLITWSSVGGKSYVVEFADGLTFPSQTFAPAASVTEGDVQPGVVTTETWRDDFSATGGAPTAGSFYRVRLR